MKIVALLTGRGNNTLKNKNILPVLGEAPIVLSSNGCTEMSSNK